MVYADRWNEVDRMMELMDHSVELLILNTCDSEKIISNAIEILIQLTAEWIRNLYSKFSVGENLDSPIFPKSCK